MSETTSSIEASATALPRLNSPEDWIEWFHRVRNDARVAEIFEYIDPEAKEPKKLTKPKEPCLADYWIVEHHYEEIEV